MRIKIAPKYSAEYIEVERPQPLSDNRIEELQMQVMTGRLEKDLTDNLYSVFKKTMVEWLQKSSLNTLKGFESFDRIDICTGCTQFIDNLYMQNHVQVLKGDYRYHERLRLAYFKEIGNLEENIPLIIAMPFPSIGASHPHMSNILQEALEKNIPVHIDGAWITCCKDIDFDFNHPAIHSVGISLSKGLGLGWNRIGLRWLKNRISDSITIMNDFNMNNRALVMIGLHYLYNLPPDYLWNTHSERYNKVCKDFDLSPTKSVYLALRNGQPVGISPLIRYLENNE